jgi:hypothetical protein
MAGMSPARRRKRGCSPRGGGAGREFREWPSAAAHGALAGGARPGAGERAVRRASQLHIVAGQPRREEDAAEAVAPVRGVLERGQAQGAGGRLGLDQAEQALRAAEERDPAAVAALQDQVEVVDAGREFGLACGGARRGGCAGRRIGRAGVVDGDPVAFRPGQRHPPAAVRRRLAGPRGRRQEYRRQCQADRRSAPARPRAESRGSGHSFDYIPAGLKYRANREHVCAKGLFKDEGRRMKDEDGLVRRHVRQARRRKRLNYKFSPNSPKTPS